MRITNYIRYVTPDHPWSMWTKMFGINMYIEYSKVPVLPPISVRCQPFLPISVVVGDSGWKASCSPVQNPKVASKHGRYPIVSGFA